MSDRVNEAILRALRREETYLYTQIHDPDDGLKVRAARIRMRLIEVEDQLDQAQRDLSAVSTEIASRT